MSEITISLTGDQEKFLKQFSSKHFEGSNDNVCTRNPLHFVQTRDEVVVDPDYETADKVEYGVPDWAEDYDSLHELVTAYYERENEDCAIKIVSFQEAYDEDHFIDINGEEQVIFEENDYLEAYGIPENFSYKTNICYRWRTVAIFFILEEAKKYMEYQGHNLTHPRTYTVDAGYANKGEYHHFWQLLFDLGEKLNEENLERVSQE